MNCMWRCCGVSTTCNCCGIAASSVAPVKRYNALVPDVFHEAQPLPETPVDAATARKIKRLVEYVDRNPQRGPKVGSLKTASQTLLNPMRAIRTWSNAVCKAALMSVPSVAVCCRVAAGG